MKCRMDLHENPEANTVTATFELPGVTKEDVHIDVHDRHLIVSGESRHSAERDEDGYAIRERRFGRFSRTVQLPNSVKVSISRRLGCFDNEELIRRCRI